MHRLRLGVLPAAGSLRLLLNPVRPHQLPDMMEAPPSVALMHGCRSKKYSEEIFGDNYTRTMDVQQKHEKNPETT